MGRRMGRWEVVGVDGGVQVAALRVGPVGPRRRRLGEHVAGGLPAVDARAAVQRRQLQVAGRFHHERRRRREPRVLPAGVEPLLHRPRAEEVVWEDAHACATHGAPDQYM